MFPHMSWLCVFVTGKTVLHQRMQSRSIIFGNMMQNQFIRAMMGIPVKALVLVSFAACTGLRNMFDCILWLLWDMLHRTWQLQLLLLLLLYMNLPSLFIDRVFTPEETTNQLYQAIAKPLVVSSVQGYNGMFLKLNTVTSVVLLQTLTAVVCFLDTSFLRLIHRYHICLWTDFFRKDFYYDGEWPFSWSVTDGCGRCLPNH